MDNISIITDKEEIKKQVVNDFSKKVYEELIEGASSEFAKIISLDEKIKKLNKWKEQFEIQKKQLENSTQLDDYLKAYEFILDFRKYLLGDIGQIFYKFLVQTDNNIIKTIYMNNEAFKTLLFSKDIHAVENFKGNIRFTNVFRQQLLNLKDEGVDISLNENQTAFCLTNINTKQTIIFNDSEKLVQQLTEEQKQVQQNQNTTNHLNFKINVFLEKEKKEANDPSNFNYVFRFKVNHAYGNITSSTVFSAVSKYIAQELSAKKSRASYYSGKRRSLLKGYDQNYDNPLKINLNNPNLGQLSEFYELAKLRLNNGHNKFEDENTKTEGDILRQIWQETKSNSDAFYTGGDVLINQIKSFLGKNPSLTSYRTIKNAITNFYDALNQNSLENIKEKLKVLLLQELSTNGVTEIEKNLSDKLIEAFNIAFK